MWKLYDDAACTIESSGILPINSKTNLTDNPQDFVRWFANVDDDPLDGGSVQLQAQSNPGVDQVQIYINDIAPGSAHSPSDITLATSTGDLAVNTPGDPLDLGTTLISGVSNAIAVYARAINTSTTVSSENNLRFRIKATVTTPVVPSGS